MFVTLRLILPALLPSWRFFDAIRPSPRIEYRLMAPAEDSGWCPALPRPAYLSPMALVAQLFWNPDGNDHLYLVSCAERLLAEDAPHAPDQINRRIARRLSGPPGALLQFRLRLVARAAGGLSDTVVYHSTPVRLGEIAP